MNRFKLNTITVNITTINKIGDIIITQVNGGGDLGGDTEIPDGYEVLMASDGVLEAIDGIIYVKSN